MRPASGSASAPACRASSCAPATAPSRATWPCTGSSEATAKAVASGAPPGAPLALRGTNDRSAATHGASMTSRPRTTINRPVFAASAFFILALVLLAAFAPQAAQRLFDVVQSWILANASWFYVLAVAVILISVVFLAFSRYGDIKLGPDHSQPDYRDITWFAMLFSTGMGIGL